MSKKIFKTIDEQIDILQARGLVVEDEDQAREVLFRENYFFLSGYRHMFTLPNSKNQFIPGTQFE